MGRDPHIETIHPLVKRSDMPHRDGEGGEQDRDTGKESHVEKE